MRLIDADALLDRIPNLYERREVSRWLDDAPTVDAVPVRRGRWERHYCEDDGLPDGWQCSACSEWYFFDHTPNFCPHCGADMRKDGDHHEKIL